MPADAAPPHNVDLDGLDSYDFGLLSPLGDYPEQLLALQTELGLIQGAAADHCKATCSYLSH